MFSGAELIVSAIDLAGTGALTDMQIFRRSKGLAGEHSLFVVAEGVGE